MDAITVAYDGDLQMIDSTSIRAEQRQRGRRRARGLLSG